MGAMDTSVQSTTGHLAEGRESCTSKISEEGEHIESVLYSDTVFSMGHNQVSFIGRYISLIPEGPFSEFPLDLLLDHTWSVCCRG